MMSQTKQSKHIVIVAGEESGDKHAAELINSIPKSYSVRLSGMGGRHLKESGVDLIFDTTHFATTGLGLIRHLSKIRMAFKIIHAHLIASKPDLLILVDYPEFNLRLAKFAKRHNIRVLYYISPQIWAWRASRIKIVKKYVDHMAVIFPFEKDFYQNAGVPVTFVGHPFSKKIKPADDSLSIRQHFNLPIDKKLIALLPGSRSNEIYYHMPVLVETMNRLCNTHQNLHFVIPVAGTLDISLIEAYFKNSHLPVTLIKDNAVQIASCSDCVAVASGTASFECALLEKPMCIFYKSNPLAYFIACLVMKVPYLGLCNIIAKHMIAPELLQYDFNADELTLLINNVLFNEKSCQSIRNHLIELKQSLSETTTDMTLSNLVIQEAQLVNS